MSRPGYEKVIQDICTLAGATDWQEVAENGVLCIDGVQMQIQPDGTDQAETLLVHVDFAPLPTERTSDFLRMLLDSNFLAGVPNSRTFSTNPQSNQVVAMRRIPLTDKIDGNTVLGILRDEAHAARTWQRGWSLGGQSKGMPPPTNPARKTHSAHSVSRAKFVERR